MTDGVTPDGKMALEWIQGLHAKKLLADEAYDSDERVDASRKTTIEVCIP